MRSCIIESSDVRDFFNDLIQMQPLMGPRERSRQPGHYQFDWLESADELVLDYTSTTLPAKKAFAAPREVLFEFSLGDPPDITHVRHTDPFTLVGVHPCDLGGIAMLDAAYGRSPAEEHWVNNRQRASIIGVDCTPDEYCFCTSVDTAHARGPADLFLTPISRGYLVEVLTDEGERLIDHARTTLAGQQDREDATRWREEKAEGICSQLDGTPEEIARALEAGGLSSIWHDLSERCFSCGSCNTTCPACFCFDVSDEFDLDLKHGRRLRRWDSCQLPEFALVAGGHNFRRRRWQRVAHRWHRKFLYLYRDFGRPYCTGCGRCSRACTADINIRRVTNEILALKRRKANNE
jgi:sulfhydrogenase subunit beta (sulfur reductase)